MKKSCKEMNIRYPKIRHTLYLFLALVSLVGLSSCKEDECITAPDNREQGTPVTVSMNIQVATYTTPESNVDAATTRAADNRFFVTFNQPDSKALTRASSGETSLYNLWVLQFSKDGAARKITKVKEIPEAIKEMVTIDTELYAGSDQIIYLVSLGKSYSEVDLSGIKTASELEKYTLDYIKVVNGVPTPRITKQDEVPYWGYQSGIEIIQLGDGGKGYVKYDPAGNFNGGISMQAMLAKVTIDLSYAVSGYTPLYMGANKVATKFAINSDRYMPTSFTDLDVLLFKTEDLGVGKRVVQTWYLPPNPQGTVDAITSQSMRYFYLTSKGEVSGSAPANGTYINLTARDLADANNFASYYIALGCNTTTDFNVFSASFYNMRTDINAAPNQNDGRVVSNKLTQKIDMSVSWKAANYPGQFNGVGVYSDLDAHTDMRPIEITMLRGSVTVSILETQGSTTPIPDAKTWLRLSNYSNYTDAFNERRAGNPNGLTSTIKLSANIPKVFKLYMYNDEYELYNMDGDGNNGKRSLYIRFFFESQSGANETYLVRMDQRPAFYVGLSGGLERNDDGSYPEGLVFEAVRETDSWPSQYLTYYPRGINIYRGCYTTVGDRLLTEYDVENKVNGRAATRFMSENPGGYPLKTGKNIPDKPHWLNGLPDLYQYTYYTHNGFGMRYCYDKNRDSNGDGKIDNEELIWYMPSYYQNLSVNFTFFADNEAIGKGLKRLFSPGASGRYSTTMYNAKNAYNVFNDYPILRNADVSGMSLNTERCVRNVKRATDSSFPSGARVMTEGNYAVIDATGYASGAYADNTTTHFFTDANGRVKRHTLERIAKENPTFIYPICEKVSARFRVAPEDLPTTMVWTEASGFASTGAESQPDIPLDPLPTGCAIYDPQHPGTWRLPTGRELVLIEMMEKALEKTAATTGFKQLTPNEYYWSATEKSNQSGQCYYALPLIPARYLDDQILHLKKDKSYRVRCIHDLPAK